MFVIILHEIRAPFLETVLFIIHKESGRDVWISQNVKTILKIMEIIIDLQKKYNHYFIKFAKQSVNILQC